MVCTSMLQAYVPNVSSVFSDVCCKCVIWMLHMFHMYIACVLSRYYVCLQWFLSVFFTCFCSDTCFKCFICLLMLQVFASRCFKSRLCIAYRIRVESGRGREQSPHGSIAQATFGRHGPHVGARNASAGGRCPSGTSPRVDAPNSLLFFPRRARQIVD
jgi:hypothetical protein